MSSKSIPLLLCALLAVSACRAAPELRLAEEAATPASIAEGRRLLEQGRAVEAVSAFRRRLREEGPDLQGLNGLAIAYSELGRSDLAADMFGRALALEPDDPVTLNNIGFSALRRADARLARRYLEKAQSRSGELEEIEGNLKQLALLETIDRRRVARPGLRLAALHQEQMRSSSVFQLALPKNGRRLPPATAGPEQSTAPDLKERTSPPLSRDMIDFMSVTDPFAGSPAAE